MTRRFVSYLRVSTIKQETSGLGLEAQRSIVETYIAGKGAHVATYVETESGRYDTRVELHKAINHCLAANAILVIAKLDRLSRDALYLQRLKKSDVSFVCCDMPEADDFIIGIMALFAEKERELISARTKAALAILKSRGVRMGGAAHKFATGLTVHKETTRALGLQKRQARALEHANLLAPRIREWVVDGATLSRVCELLNEGWYVTATGLRGRWHVTQVSIILKLTQTRPDTNSHNG